MSLTTAPREMSSWRTTGYYNLAAEVIQIPKPAERRGRGKGLRALVLQGAGHAGLRPPHPQSLHSVGQVKGTVNGGKTRLRVACDNKNDKDSGATASTLYECPQIFMSSSPKTGSGR